MTMNSTSTTVGGWADCELRATLNSTYLGYFPQNLQNAIKSVNKAFYRYEDTSEQVAADKLWIPSSQEICFTGNYLKETTGIVYSGVFSSYVDRMKCSNNGTMTEWYTRSAHSASSFVTVTTEGAGNSKGASNTSGICLGFCI